MWYLFLHRPSVNNSILINSRVGSKAKEAKERCRRCFSFVAQGVCATRRTRGNIHLKISPELKQQELPCMRDFVSPVHRLKHGGGCVHQWFHAVWHRYWFQPKWSLRQVSDHQILNQGIPFLFTLLFSNTAWISTWCPPCWSSMRKTWLKSIKWWMNGSLILDLLRYNYIQLDCCWLSSNLYF